MFGKYKIIVNTAAGRRQYLKLLIPQVLCNEYVDQYDLWVNTTNKLDIAFLEKVESKYSKINLIWQPDNIINGVESIDSFYQFCQDENTIYIKLDDDVVWLEPNFFQEILNFRINNPNYFLVSPLVINNDISTYILQNEGLLEINEYYPCSCYKLEVYNGYFAQQLHQWFIDRYLKLNNNSDLHCGHFDIALNRFAINAIVWFGYDLKNISGIIIGDDEEFLTVKYPAKIRKNNCFDCNTLIVHYAFSLQRTVLDKTSILEQYYNILKMHASSEILNYIEEINSILSNIEINKKYFLSKNLSHPYIQIHNNKESKYGLFLAILGIEKSHRTPLIRIISKVRNAKRKYIKM